MCAIQHHQETIIIFFFFDIGGREERPNSTLLRDGRCQRFPRASRSVSRGSSKRWPFNNERKSQHRSRYHLRGFHPTVGAQQRQ